MTKRMKTILARAGLLCAVACLPLGATQAAKTDDVAPLRSTASSPASEFTNRLIVKFHDAAVNRATTLSAAHVATLTAAGGVQLTHWRPMSGDAQVMRLPQNMRRADVEAIAQRLRASPDVAYAEPDYRLYPAHGDTPPSDPYYGLQWSFKPSATEIGGADIEEAWSVTVGAAGVTVAMIDTGLLPHADINAARVAPGYDFISVDTNPDGSTTPWTANDGDGRDANPADPGDWTTANDCFDGWQGNISSWHGTHIAGIIGASGDNGIGITGINLNSKLLPVRVLGRCGGYTSDIVDAIRWSAGLAVSGVPANANPAKVLNLSLGGTASCGGAFQDAVDAATAAGAVLIVAAGNENVDAVNSRPANCNNVVTVAATNRSGDKASYSNFGSRVKIAAPGGDIGNGIVSTLNNGTTTPIASPGGDIYVSYMGTSMAAPHVSGVASLMLSVNPSLTPAQISQKLQRSARPFPAGSTCTTSNCGAGMLNANAAVHCAQGGHTPTANAGSAQSVNPGVAVTLAGYSPDDCATAFSWTQTAGATVTLTGANSAHPSFTAPAPSGPLTFRLVLSNDDGINSTAATVVVTVNNVAPVLAPIGNKSINQNATLNFTVSASDANGTTPILSASSLPTGATFNAATGAFSWTPTASGSFPVTFIATDAADGNLKSQQTVTVSVQAQGGGDSGGGGGGCSLGSGDKFDPTLLILALIAVAMQRRRRAA